MSPKNALKMKVCRFYPVFRSFIRERETKEGYLKGDMNGDELYEMQKLALLLSKAVQGL